ncbi:BofC C-terminal domain-containing protein [Alteribacter natronophilus]|uniref:BofC C-terminal domain-containing protein n=1 Tax=Alteribacter natronophilus TaxID=2583810 RepID=UPI00110E0302|nr:BofC C-terminal domain-containing protein [Alteribacter natronophilus]TMW73980.1 sporulation-like protein BofC [Alteribacter natronophilus]
MSATSIYLLRRKKPGILPVILIVLLFVTAGVSYAEAEEERTQRTDNGAWEVNGPQTVDVVLQRVYLDGEVSEEIVEEVIWSMEDFWSYYDEWQLIDHDYDQVIFRQDVNDISPLLKLNGYFGLSPDGMLNIYNGKPEDNEVIQSFWQINTKELKSHAHTELKKGIPVFSRDQYLDVLQIYEKYALEL